MPQKSSKSKIGPFALKIDPTQNSFKTCFSQSIPALETSRDLNWSHYRRFQIFLVFSVVFLACRHSKNRVKYVKILKSSLLTPTMMFMRFQGRNGLTKTGFKGFLHRSIFQPKRANFLFFDFFGFSVRILCNVRILSNFQIYLISLIMRGFS